MFCLCSTARFADQVRCNTADLADIVHCHSHVQRQLRENLRLQEYNVSKRVEHQFKALVHDARTISAVSPVTYSRRFQSFLLNIFRPKPVKATATVLKLAVSAEKGNQEAAAESKRETEQASRQPDAID
jgi:Phosphatidylinositol-4-phosphate 5-Kinase